MQCFIRTADNNPSPDAYRPPTLFKPNNTTSTFAVHCKGPRTYSFGAGREAYKIGNHKSYLLKVDPAIPGPGTYDPQAPLGANAVKFKLKGKLHYGEPDLLAIKEDLPPPGTYGD